MPEQPFFSDSAVQVTSTEARFGLIHIPLGNIRSARIEDVRPRKTALYAIGSGMIVLGFAMLLLKWFVLPERTLLYNVINLTCNLILILGVLALSVWERNTKYVVKVSGSFGEKDVVIARNYSYARKVVKAIKAAQEAAVASGALPASG
jgi:hypothetical protein